MYRTRNSNWTVPNAVSDDGQILARALIWLAVGAVLGLIVAVPYDQLLGLPSSTGAILGSVVWAVLLGMSYPRRTD